MPDNWVGTLTGPALHLIFLASVFDIHFKSPVLRLPDPAAPSYPAPASRLVLFVADGLRGQSFYEAGTGEFLKKQEKMDPNEKTTIAMLSLLSLMTVMIVIIIIRRKRMIFLFQGEKS